MMMSPGEYAPLLIDYFNAAKQSLTSITQSFSFGHTGIYRGRFNNIGVLILSDQYSFTDMFSGRALTGKTGQKMQSIINTFSGSDDYLILRSLPVNCIKGFDKNCTQHASTENVSKARNKILNKVFKNNSIKLILTIGPAAKKIVELLSKPELPTINIKPEDLSNKMTATAMAHKIQNTLNPNSLLITSEIKLRLEDEYIPRRDLPFMTRWWMGTGGDLGMQARRK